LKCKYLFSLIVINIIVNNKSIVGNLFYNVIDIYDYMSNELYTIPGSSSEVVDVGKIKIMISTGHTFTTPLPKK